MGPRSTRSGGSTEGSTQPPCPSPSRQEGPQGAKQGEPSSHKTTTPCSQQGRKGQNTCATIPECQVGLTSRTDKQHTVDNDCRFSDHTHNNSCNNTNNVDIDSNNSNEFDNFCILLTLASSNSCTNVTNNIQLLNQPVSEISCNNISPAQTDVYFDDSLLKPIEIKHNQLDCCVECIHLFYSDFTLVLDHEKAKTIDLECVNNDRPSGASALIPPQTLSSWANSFISLSNNKVHGKNKVQQRVNTAPSDNENKFSYLGERVVNLSKYQLSKSEVSLLEKGITFAPTPGDADIGEIQTEVNKFIRRILLKLHFYDPDLNDNNSFKDQIPPGMVKFRNPSSWTPPAKDPCVRAFMNNVQQSLSDFKPRSRATHNLTKEERLALNNLKTKGDIVIKKADKGSSIVVMNRSDYISEAERQLSDTNFYQPQENDLTSEHQGDVGNLVERLFRQNKISEPIYNCLHNRKPKTSSLYLLPKIHKIKKPGEFPPGRPIISANGSPTERISAFVDENIKGAVPKLKSHIKDTTDFIHRIENL